MDMADLLNDAERRGYTINFAIQDDRLRCTESGDCFSPDDVEVVYSRAVDMGTDPGDDATIYLLETSDGRKGYVMIADSFHVDPRKAAFIQRLVGGRGTRSTG